MRISEQELVTTYIPLVRKIATRIYYRIPGKIEYQELVSAGILGLVDAVTKFDENRRKEFRSYAEMRVKGAIIDELRSRDFISRQQRKRYKDFEKERIRLESEAGRRLSLYEISDRLDVPYKDLEKTYQHAASAHHSELNEAIYYTKGDQQLDPMDAFRDTSHQSPFKKLFYKEMRQELVQAIKNLPDRNQLILSLYYEQELNFKEIGLVLELTESRVSQLHKITIKKLQEHLAKY